MKDITEFDLVVLEAIFAGAKSWYSIERFLAKRAIIPNVLPTVCLKKLKQMGLIEYYLGEDDIYRIKITELGEEVVNLKRQD